MDKRDIPNSSQFDKLVEHYGQRDSLQCYIDTDGNRYLITSKDEFRAQSQKYLNNLEDASILAGFLCFIRTPPGKSTVHAIEDRDIFDYVKMPKKNDVVQMIKLPSNVVKIPHSARADPEHFSNYEQALLTATVLTEPLLKIRSTRCTTAFACMQWME